MSEYQIREISTREFGELWVPHGKRIFEDESQIFSLRNALSEEELAKSNSLKSNLGEPIRINLGIYRGDEFVGWSWGYQESNIRFYMCNSAILPKHRRKGLYSKLLKEMMTRIEDLGFQEIFSRHTPTNNPIIIAKLKAGFVITSMEISDIFGTLIHLSYYPNQLRKKMLEYRVGEIKPDSEIKKLLGIE
ncbi:MAG: GNAT family N-acetyltransferase [Bacteriovoracaceae bacterium]|jgi:ribosomal protein S18 acetylase RimI-like enzyme|nr:GNAT family N-acetyltransferase [Bacteriovoracaceae bacterium]